MLLENRHQSIQRQCNKKIHLQTPGREPGPTLIKKGRLAHLGASHTDDAVGMPISIVEERDGDCMLAGWDPVALSSWIDLEHMRSGTENGLLPTRETKHVGQNTRTRIITEESE